MSQKKRKTIRLRQMRSGVGYARDQRATLNGLSLGRPGWTSEVPDTPAVRGMIRKVRHLVRVEGEE
jgi:large subunit ribosomal protein L30